MHGSLHVLSATAYPIIAVSYSCNLFITSCAEEELYARGQADKNLQELML
jgi:hypothetical protein